MPYDEKLGGRVRKALAGRKGIAEKKMFGGVAFLLNGNVCCGVHADEMIVRLNPEETDQALAKPHTRIFDMTGRPMKGWILVKSAGVASEDALAKWVSMGVSYAASLPAKK
ncbi:MAG: TfoX/Sxy family protein [Betaproteobacteria bacterium]|nr:MAG: TfoX/Sxy family protein [Betaproteobacteria bacterium]